MFKKSSQKGQPDVLIFMIPIGKSVGKLMDSKRPGVMLDLVFELCCNYR